MKKMSPSEEVWEHEAAVEEPAEVYEDEVNVSLSERDVLSTPRDEESELSREISLTDTSTGKEMRVTKQRIVPETKESRVVVQVTDSEKGKEEKRTKTIELPREEVRDETRDKKEVQTERELTRKTQRKQRTSAETSVSQMKLVEVVPAVVDEALPKVHQESIDGHLEMRSVFTANELVNEKQTREKIQQTETSAAVKDPKVPERKVEESVTDIRPTMLKKNEAASVQRRDADTRPEEEPSLKINVTKSSIPPRPEEKEMIPPRAAARGTERNSSSSCVAVFGRSLLPVAPLGGVSLVCKCLFTLPLLWIFLSSFFFIPSWFLVRLLLNINIALNKTNYFLKNLKRRPR